MTSPDSTARRLIVLAALVMILSTALAVLASGAGRVLPSAGEIAFYSNTRGFYRVSIIDVGTRLIVPLTREGDAYMPSWSPDGAQLAFVSTRDGNPEIYVMQADGTQPRRLTYDRDRESRPVWSPDGRRLAFESVSDGARRIYVMDVETRTRVMAEQGASATGVGPIWSPDSTRLAYYGVVTDTPELFVAAVGARMVGERLTDNAVGDWTPVWSPDGRWLAYYANTDANVDLYALRLDTQQVTRLTFYLSREWLPVWSPDGRSLALLSDRDGSASYYWMDVTCLETGAPCGGEILSLGGMAFPLEEAPVWSPDGSRLAYVRVSTSGGALEIDLVDTRCVRERTPCAERTAPLTPGDASARGPVWRPASR
jgi:Tol biopolymer transport system component